MRLYSCQHMRPSLRTIAPFLAAALMTALPAAAHADTTTSSNWSGYAVHRSGVSFRHVTGTWTVPSADCASASPGYSAAWVGLGGYAVTSPALEQIGTETDCTAQGRVKADAWFELVPSPSHSLSLTVHPGDLVTASVTVAGDRVTVTLNDRTRKRTATKTSTDHTLDVSSAEWIVEAPSECVSTTACATLPLADFGTVGFGGASAQDAHGQTGPIDSRHWQHTEITLASSPARAFVSDGSTRQAIPSALSASGHAFTVGFSETAAQPGSGPPLPLTAGQRAASARQPALRR
jgi:hypothetical protein